MLGALLASLKTTNPQDFPDTRILEDEAEESHWSSDKNRFEDWLLNGDASEAGTSDPEFYY
jgi:hypothetical protein